MRLPTSTLGKDTLASLAVRVAGSVVGFIATMASARVLGVSDKGTLAAVAAVAGIVSSVMGLGLGSALTVAVARGGVRSRSAVGILWCYSLAISAASAAVLGQPEIASLLGLRGSGAALVACGAGIGGLILADAVAGILQGLGRIKGGMFVRHIAGLLQSAGIIGLALLDTRSVVQYAVLVAAAGWIAGSVASAMAYASQLRAEEKLAEDWSWRRVLSLGIRTQAVWILLMLNYRVDMILLASLRTQADVGVYSIAVSFSEAAWFGVNAIVAVLLPHLAKGERRLAGLRAARSARVAVVFTTLASAVIYTFLRVWGKAIFGPGFGGSSLAFLALAPGLIMFCWYKVLAIHAIGTGRLGVPTLLAAAGLVANVLCNLALIPRYGAVGAATSSSLSYSVVAVAMLIAFARDNDAAVTELVLIRRSDFAAVFRGLRP